MILSALILLIAAISSIFLMPLPVFSSSDGESGEGGLQQQQPQQSQQSLQQGLQGQQQLLQHIPKQQDMVLLSARLNDDGFGGQQIVGEVKNSGTESAEFIQPFVTFRDVQGVVVDTALTYAEKQRIQSGDTSPFNLYITSEVVNQQAKTYDLSLEWQDLQGNEFTSDVLTNQPFTPGAVNDVSFSISSSSGGGDDDDNPDPCEGINENVSQLCPIDNQTNPSKPNPPQDNQTNPEPDPIECSEGSTLNPSTGQCEPVSVPVLTLLDNAEQQLELVPPSPPSDESGEDDIGGDGGEDEGSDDDNGDGGVGDDDEGGGVGDDGSDNGGSDDGDGNSDGGD